VSRSGWFVLGLVAGLVIAYLIWSDLLLACD
jgi:hypothetical protein